MRPVGSGDLLCRVADGGAQPLKRTVELEEAETQVPDQWHVLLHRLWSKAVGAPDYAKDEWMELESILFRAAARLLQKQTEDPSAG